MTILFPGFWINMLFAAGAVYLLVMALLMLKLFDEDDDEYDKDDK